MAKPARGPMAKRSKPATASRLEVVAVEKARPAAVVKKAAAEPEAVPGNPPESAEVAPLTRRQRADRSREELEAVPLPQSVEEVLALEGRDLSLAYWKQLQHRSSLKLRRAELIRAGAKSAEVLVADAELAQANVLLDAITSRRTAERRRRRQEHGEPLRMAEAIATAAESVLREKQWLAVKEEADRLMRQAARDLQPLED